MTKFVCCICLYVRTGIAPPAITIVGGLAVCEDHMSYVTDTKLSWIIGLIHDEEKRNDK